MISSLPITIDINCDMGEGIGKDAALMPYISSANIACGYHAGDEDTMKRTIELALKQNVAIGAHPGFNDRNNFGRKEIKLSTEGYYNLIIEQLQVITHATLSPAARVSHVKPHGALYNMAARDRSIAATIAKAVKDFDENLVLFGLSGSYSISEAEAIGLTTASEVFADRTYQDNGALTPRSEPDALIEDEHKSLQQVLQMIQHQIVTSINNRVVPIVADTICIHGDGEHAVTFAKSIYQMLKENNIQLKSRIKQ